MNVHLTSVYTAVCCVSKDLYLYFKASSGSIQLNSTAVIMLVSLYIVRGTGTEMQMMRLCITKYVVLLVEVSWNTCSCFMCSCHSILLLTLLVSPSFHVHQHRPSESLALM